MSSRAGCGVDPSDRLRDMAHLASAVGHHLINSYSTVVSNAELLRTLASSASGGTESRLAGSIVSTALDASRVARSLIAWTREATRPGAFVNSPMEPVDLARIVERVVAQESNETPLAIEWILRIGETPRILGDAPQLEAMLRAIVRNAVEAFGAGAGTVTIRTGIDASDWLFIEIQDDGCGMPQEVQVRATEPFFTTRPGHEGVGLTIAQGIWRRHEGSLAIESQPAHGTTVRLGQAPTARRNTAP